MATARKCDRCGKYYDLSDFHPYLKDGKTYKLTRVHFSSNNALYAVSYDLCPACIGKLMVFLDDFYKSKERFKDDEYKHCQDCEYYAMPINCSPCFNCINWSHWHEKNADDSEKKEE